MLDNEELETAQDTASEAGQEPASLAEKSILFLVMASVLILDHVSQLIVEARLPLNSSWEPVPAISSLFKISHVANTGAAFGIFPGGSLIFTIVAIVVSGAIIFYNSRLPANHQLYRVALGLQLGGALGNLIDRLRIGHVTDFLDFGPVPVFNFADASIFVGVVLLAYLMFQDERRQKVQDKDAPHRPGEEESLQAEASEEQAIP